jgi:tetratricopeptide (TPR) repeat protein
MDSRARFPKAKPAEQKTPYERFSEFLRRFRLLILALFGAIVLAIIAIAVIQAIGDAQLNASTASAEKLDADYAAYRSEQDQAKKADLEKSFLASADTAIKQWPRRYAGLRALLYKAKIEESKKDWAGAEKDWLAIVKASPDSYLAPIAIQDAAVAAEEQDANDRATADYRKLIDKYSEKTIGIPHAYFALGRLSEQTKDYAAALVAYQKLTSTWPESDWTKLATDRIIFMKSHGLSK